MSGDAPERVWIGKATLADLAAGKLNVVAAATNRFARGVEYVRADVADALLAHESENVRIVERRWREAQAAIAQVRALHDNRGRSRCWHCGYRWPCPTLAALDPPAEHEAEAPTCPHGLTLCPECHDANDFAVPAEPESGHWTFCEVHRGNLCGCDASRPREGQ